MKVAESLSVPSVGVDTWSPAWRIDSRKLDDQVTSLFSIQSAGGARVMKEKSPSGHTLGFYPHAGWLFAEGHPAGDGQLAGGDSLGYRLADLEVELSDLGLHMGGTKFMGMRRLDATADLRFAEKSAGVIALAVLAAIQYPHVKVQTVRAVGDSRVETVLLKGRAGRKTLGRMYDKGVESGSAAPGEWARFEDQRRFTSSTGRPQISEMTAPKIKEQFHKRFMPLYTATKGVTVAGPAVLDQQLETMVQRGEITPAQAMKMSGYVHMGFRLDLAKTTNWRLRSQLREIGLYTGDGIDPEELIASEVDVGALLEAALDSDGWGVG